MFISLQRSIAIDSLNFIVLVKYLQLSYLFLNYHIQIYILVLFQSMEFEKLYPLMLTALVAVCYSNSLRCGLVFDDVAAISDNRDIRPHTPISNIFLNDFWGTPLKKV